MTSLYRALALGSLLFIFSLPSLADDTHDTDSRPSAYAQLWIDDTATVTDDALAQAMADLARQGPTFDIILVMTHGFDLEEDISTSQLEWLSQKFRDQFGKKTRLGIIGLQWHSASHAFLVPTGSAYLHKIALARSAGRGPARQLLLAVQAKYPKVGIALLGHSTGCDLTSAAIYPEIRYDGTEPFVEAFEPGRPLKVMMHILVGSDVDYDLWQKSQISAETLGDRCRLTWQTMLDFRNDRTDVVLAGRALFFEKAAGNNFPKMTLPQLDRVVSQRQLLLDCQDVPETHLFVDYFDDDRVARLTETMTYLTAPKTAKPKSLAMLDKVLAAPNEIKALTPYLDSENCGQVYYALWRLERKLEGDARHLTDDTYYNTLQLLRSHPQNLWRDQADSPCAIIRAGIFPTKKMMTAAGAPPWARPEKWR